MPSSADFISTLSCTHFGRRTFSAEHSQSNLRSQTLAVEHLQSNIYSRTLTVEPSQSNQSSKRHASRGSRRTLQSHNRRNEIPITFYDDADLLKRVRRDKRVSRIERTHVALAGKQKLWKQFRSLSHQTLAEVYYHLICFPISFSNRKRSNRKMLSLLRSSRGRIALMGQRIVCKSVSFVVHHCSPGSARSHSASPISSPHFDF